MLGDVLGLIDIVILVVLVFFLLKGILRGLLREVCSLLGLVLGGLFAFTFHLPLAQLLQNSFGLPAQLCVWGAFLAIFLLVVFCFAVIGYILNRFVKNYFLRRCQPPGWSCLRAIAGCCCPFNFCFGA